MLERQRSSVLFAAAFAIAIRLTAGSAPSAAAPGTTEQPPATALQPETILPDEVALDSAQPAKAEPNPHPLGLPEQAPERKAPKVAIACTGAGGPWSATGTWAGGVVPTAADGVTVASGCTITIDTAAVALSVLVQSGGVLEFDSAAAQSLTVAQSVTIDNGGIFRTPAAGTVTTHVLSVGADLTNNGTLDFSTNGNTAGAGITFTNAGNATFGGTGATTNIRTLTVNKGTSFSNVLEVSTSSLTVQGTAVDGAPMAFLTLTNGTLEISGTFTLAGRLFTAAAYSIPATGGIWLNNPNVTVSGQAGSPTNNGLLRLTKGTYNVGTGSGNSMGAGNGASFTVEGGTLNVTGRLTSSATYVTYTQSGGTVNVSTVGNASSSTPSFGFTGTSGVVMNISGGVINLVQASTAATPVDYNQGGTMSFTGGTLNVGTSATATNFVFRVQGQMPHVVIDNTTNNKTANLSGQGNVWGNLTISTGTTLNLNPGTAQTLLMIGPTLTNNGAIVVNTTNTGTVNFAGTLQTVGVPYAQSYAGSGTFGAAALRVGSLSVQSALGVTVTAGVSALNIYRVNAFFGSISGSGNLAIGASDATAVVVQRGAAGISYPAGSLDVAPTYGIGAGGLTLVYAQSASPVTTGPEVPAGRSILSLQTANPTGVTLAGGPLTTSSTTSGLVLGGGTLTTSGANLLTLDGTATGSLSGGSATTYVNGPLARTLPASLVAGSTYTFPVGKGSFKMLELVSPTTTAGGTVVVQVEVFDTGSGGSAGAGLSSINTNRYWSAAITSGAANFTNATVRLTEQGTPTVNAIGQSATLAGAYASVGGTVTPPTIGPSSTVTSLDYFVVGTLSGGTPLCGSYDVGAAAVAPNFTTLTAAVAAFNSRLVTCPVTFSLLDNIYAGETYPIQINANGGSSATNTLTIKPAPAATPVFVGSSATALVILNGADWVTIDGSNAPGGTTRNTTFQNTNTGTSSAVIWGQTAGTSDPATNNTIKNLNVAGNASTTTLVGIGFGSSVIATTSTGTRNDGNRIQNNAITSLQFGILSQGAASANKNLGTVITGNVLGGAGASALGRAGIYVGFEDGVQVTNNTVNGVSSSASVDVFGIALGSIAISVTAFTTNNDVANAVVTGNVVGPVVQTNTFSAAGISMGNNNYGTSRIANNVVYGVVSDGTAGDFTAGIYVGNSGTAGSTTQIYFNSVSMTGLRDSAPGGNASQPSYALAVLGANPLVDIRDNVLYNTQTSAGGSGAGSYAIGLSSTAPYTNVTSNYNDLFASGASSHFAATGSLVNVLGDRTTLAAWQAATGKDANSPSVDPLFTSTTNLHLQPASTLVAAGTPAGGITTDMDGDTRSLTAPDIGADEVVPLPASLSITKSHAGAPAPGQSITYTITVTNAGPRAAAGTTVADAFAAPLGGCTYTATQTGGASGFTASGSGSINDTAVTLPVSSSVVYTATCSIGPGAIGSLSNTATVTAGAGVVNTSAAGSATDSYTLAPSTDLSITNTDGVTTAAPGGSVTYTIVASNAGPSTATGATVTDSFPPSLTCTWTCAGAGGGTCSGSGAGDISDAASLPPGGSVTYTASCAISPSATGTLSNTATVVPGPGATDPTLPNVATDTTTLVSSADVAVRMAVDNAAPGVGSNVTFTITATNNGPSPATGVKVTDLLPPGLTFVSDTGAGAYAPLTGVWTVGGLASGGSASLQIVATVNRTGALVNQATKTAQGENDPDSSNNAALVVLNGPAPADIQVRKTVDNLTPLVGSNVTFTIAVKNAGPSNASGVVVTDQLPAGLTYVSHSTANGTYTPGTGVWNIGFVNNLDTVTLQIVATVSAAGARTNTATRTAANEPDLITANDAASVTLNAAGALADLALSKTASQEPASSGTNFFYTIVVVNNGPAAATGVTVTDDLTAVGVNLNLTTASQGSCSGNPVLCSLGTIPAGGSASITLDVTKTVSGSISNVASVTANETDPNPANNSNGESTTPVELMRLDIE